MADVHVFDLSDAPVLEAFGPDTRRWLNGMISQNVRDMEVGASARSAITDSKGRMQGLLWVACLADDRFLLVGDGVEGEWLFDRLDMYIIMDEVELEERDHRVLSLQGEGSAALAAGLAERAVVVAERDRTGLGGVDLVVQAAELDAVLAELPAPTDELEMLRVRAGKPRWPVDMDQKTFVHELGLVDELCSFVKGCYIGQEVINRMNVMGKVNRSLRRVALDAAVTGDVFVDDEKAGSVSSAVVTDDGVVGLGLLRKAAWEPGTAIRVVGEGVEASGRVL